MRPTAGDTKAATETTPATTAVAAGSRFRLTLALIGALYEPLHQPHC
jgi:hypothetical protein